MILHTVLGVLAVTLILLLCYQQWYLFRFKKMVRAEFRTQRKAHQDSMRFIQSTAHLQNVLPAGASYPALVGWRAAPDFMAHIVDYILEKKPKLVVECGSGCTTLIIASLLKQQGYGRLISLEHEAGYLDLISEQLRERRLENWVDLVRAPLVEWRGGAEYRWYATDELERMKLSNIELLVVDGPPVSACTNARYPAMSEFASHMNSGAVVLLDDADRVAEQAISKLWEDQFPGWRKDYIDSIKGTVKFTKL